MSIDSERRKAVREAWNRERSLVKEGKGTRNWNKSEQKQLLATGRVKGYYGHHKCSVKNNPSQAGNSDNIQFLTRKEHYKAHDGNYKNDPHGRYDPSTGKVTKYSGNARKEPEQRLTNKLSEGEVKAADKKYAKMMDAKRQESAQKRAMRAKEEQAKAQKYKNEKSNARSVKKEGSGLRARRAGKSESRTEAVSASSASRTQSRALQKQRALTPSKPSAATQSQSLSRQRSAANTASSARTSSQSKGTGKSTAGGSGHKH